MNFDLFLWIYMASIYFFFHFYKSYSEIEFSYSPRRYNKGTLLLFLF